MKKLLILVLVLAAIAAGFIPVVTTKMADNAFSRPNDASAQESLKEAIFWKMRLYMFTEARRIAERAIVWFPESENIDAYIYCAARCAERDEAPSAAIHWYSRFLELFPDHPWSKDVRARLSKLHPKTDSAKGS